MAYIRDSFEEKAAAGIAKVELIDDILVVSEWSYPTYRFRLVEHATAGYFAWNIGSEHMPDGYLPLCRLVSAEICWRTRH